jgi:glyoxylase-like metal-dependent hydrolase (beta-lactamase superfamily II)
MKIINLTKGSKVYTSNVYLITGDWNTLNDVNTLIDVGADPLIIDKIQYVSTGVGKRPVEQVILTHNHSDHTAILDKIKQTYNPAVFAHASAMEGLDVKLAGGEAIRVADRIFEIIHAPGHSSDSICLYCEEEEILFSGDNPLIINSSDTNYNKEYIDVLKHLCQKKISIIYFGHGKPLKKGCREALLNSLKNAR